MNFLKFKLLMWKNYRLRRYHWIVTLIELGLPVLFTYFLVKFSAVFTHENSTAKRNETIYRPFSRNDFITRLRSDVIVYYAPQNDATDQFMNQTRKYFGSIQGCANESDLEIALGNGSDSYERYLSRTSKFGIFFKNVSLNGTLPDKLVYELRNTNKWSTRLLYPEFERAGPVEEYPYYYNHFSPIQFLINEQFIKMKTNQDYSEVEFEWFPYPEYTSDESPRSWIALGVGALVIFIVLIVSLPLISDIIEEKDSGVKELMKITGLDEWMMWFSWFMHAFVVSFVSLTIVAIILTQPVFTPAGSEAIGYVHPSIIWAFLILYCIANISYCFMFSSIFQKTTIASAIFVLVFALLIFGVIKLTDIAANHPVLRLATLTPVGAFILGFAKIRYYEMLGIEYTWTSVATSENSASAISLMFCMFMLLVDTVLYLFLAYYITAINPGKFGARKSPFFIFERLMSRFSDNDSQPLQNLDDKVESEFMEAPPPNVEATIQIKDLHKHYGLVYAARGVNLNIYQGELTALLGHNGAGKTTTMSIMTGLTSPSAGTIHYKNMDIFKNMQKFRQNLGMCPQENRTMPYLTVLEHLIFFGQLKGVSREAAESEANEYLHMMELDSKRNALAKELSGGMKRKLCLSVALMGKAEVLILDEPTSGMDVQSRRKIWDLLLDLRGERTVIFTTHYMEEADALGDRIAIMNHGVIVCHGTPIFLKKAYNTGYELTITKSIESSDGIEQVIYSVLPEASRELETAQEVVYKLPLTETEKFPTLFKSLESEMNQLGIKHIGVAATTMEHVFLKVGGISIYDAKATRNTTVTDSIRDSNFLRHIKGLSLAAQQIAAIFKKKFLYTTRTLFSIFTRIILPTLIGLFVLNGLKSIDLTPEPPLDLSLTTYPGSTVVLRNGGGAGIPNFAKYLSEYVSEKGGVLVNADVGSTIERDLLKEASDILKYNKDYISAFDMNSTAINILSNPPLIHGLPITITTFSNVLLRSITNSKQYEIQTINYPVQEGHDREAYPERHSDVRKQVSCSFPGGSSMFYSVWFIAVGFYCVDLISYFAVFVNTERVDGFQHIQLMSNVPPLVYWFGTLMFDLSFFLIVTALRVTIFQTSNNTSFLGFDSSLGVFVMLAILYGIGGLLFTYVTGHLSNTKDGSYTLLFIFNLICAIVVWIFYGVERLPLLEIPGTSQQDWPLFYAALFYVVKAIILLVPSLNFALLFIKLMMIFIKNAECTFCSDTLRPNCDAGHVNKPYLVFPSPDNPDGLLQGVLFLLFDILLYSAILAFINMGYCRYWFNSLKNAMYTSDSLNKDTGDYDVQLEFNKVQQYKEDRAKRNQVALLVDGLRKNYINWFKPFTAVSDVSFIVEPGECFGLLGVNGAGKSTTFKMLTAEIVPTKGDAAIETIKLSTDKMQYLSMAGYCPQTNCFIEELTGREMLSMIAAMRGVSGSGNKALVDKWINIIGLEEFQNQRCGTYSGGNKRKLCTAMSLIGDPKVVFLDEPTSGVDPVSRRNLYDVMGQSKEAGQAVILTSHSMEECETLCNRLTIMVAGVMKCIGTTQHLKKRYAQGFSVLIKINDIPNFNDEIEALKRNMTQAFTAKYCILKDEHRGLLYYQIKDTSIPWSTLFEKMEAMKKHHRQLIDDYVLTDTTLEEVFISFAKECSYTNESESHSGLNKMRVVGAAGAILNLTGNC